VPDERLQAEPDGVGVSGGTARNLGMLKQFHVDVQSLLHTSNSTIPRWLYQPCRVDAAIKPLKLPQDRLHHYRIAAGSAAEIRFHLAMAVAWGDVDRAIVALTHP
jgi:hypothetical protein